MKRPIISAFLSLLIALPLAAQTERVKLPGMEKAGTITRDERGIAHIFALNERDLLFLQGWVHAEDRFFQMDMNRRTAQGTLAEMVGMSALSTDVLLRTVGLGRAAEWSLAEMDPETRRLLEGYAAGVNAWLERNDLPIEYASLELSEVPPWTALDTVSIAKLLAFGLSFDLDTDLTVDFLTWVGVGDAAGFDGAAMFFEDLFRIEPFGDASTIPDASGVSVKRGADELVTDRVERYQKLSVAARSLAERAGGLAREVSEAFSSSPYLKDVMDLESFMGSNEWGIGPDLSASGRPMIANDPHLALDAPSTFYPIALQAGKINAIGMGFAGVPYVVIGHTPGIGWGATVNPMDVTDVYAEEVVIVPESLAGLATRHGDEVEWLFPILQTWRVNVIGDGEMNSLQTVPAGGSVPRATLLVLRKNAPIIALDVEAGTALSLQYTGLYPTQEIEMFRRTNRAMTIEEFRDSLQWFDFGSQNWAVVDSTGDYGYFTSAELPLREDLEATMVNGLPPFFIRDGTGGNDWIVDPDPAPAQAVPYEILPFEEMPQIVNPPAGWFVNANNDPAGTTLDNDPLNQLRPTGGIYYLNVGYDGFRGERVTEMIEEKIAAGEEISFEDMQRMQADTVMVDAEFFVPWILQAFENAQGSANPILGQFAASPAVGGAVMRLSNWDFSTPTGIPEGWDASDENGQLSMPSDEEIANSVAATIYSVWRGQFIANTIDTVIGGIEQLAGMDLPRPGSGSTLSSLRNFLENWETTQGFGASGVNFFNVPGVDDPAARRDILLLKSVADALGLITSDEFAPAFGNSMDMNDWRWGKLHRIVFDHPLGGPLSIPPAGGAFPQPLEGLPGIPTDGGFGVVDASSHSARADGVNEFMYGSGASRRFVASGASDGIVAETSLPGGVSGNVASPYYMNLLPMWLTNEAFPSVLRPMPRIPWAR